MCLSISFQLFQQNEKNLLFVKQTIQVILSLEIECKQISHVNSLNIRIIHKNIVMLR